MKAPFFSVLIDTYNYGEYIDEAVSSALAQDFPAKEREFWLWMTVPPMTRKNDCGNSERRFVTCESRMAGRPRRSISVSSARGEVIPLLDADDVWLPEKLGRVYETFERHPDVGMVYHRVHLWSGGDEISGDTYFIPISGHVAEDRRALHTWTAARGRRPSRKRSIRSTGG